MDLRQDVMSRLSVIALLTGKPVPFRDGQYSAIAKTPVSGRVRIGWLGLEGDSVADTVHHGGWDKAIHLYPQDHYAFWSAHMGNHPLLESCGAFGENIASVGLDEEQLCIGDRFTLGTAIIEVSHGRQPCSKLDHRFGRRDVMATIVKTGRSGLYFRVVREGEADADGDMTMDMIARPHPEWPVARVFRLLIGGGHKQDKGAVRHLADMPLLADAWRQRARNLSGA